MGRDMGVSMYGRISVDIWANARTNARAAKRVWKPHERGHPAGLRSTEQGRSVRPGARFRSVVRMRQASVTVTDAQRRAQRTKQVKQENARITQAKCKRTTLRQIR